MTNLPVVTNASGSSAKKAESIFTSSGQTKEFHQRPRIAAAKPQAPSKPSAVQKKK
jgi:hypothetical protein